jgi:hypothetical protein
MSQLNHGVSLPPSPASEFGQSDWSTGETITAEKIKIEERRKYRSLNVLGADKTSTEG